MTRMGRMYTDLIREDLLDPCHPCSRHPFRDSFR
jgi:hypothetical protein